MPILLSNAELARLRADLARLLPDTAVIYAASTSTDGAGGVTETWAPVSGGTVSCRVDPLTRRRSDNVIQAASRQSLAVDYQITLPYDAPIAAHRRIVTGGRTYDVVQLASEHSWSVSRRVLAARVD